MKAVVAALILLFQAPDLHAQLSGEIDFGNVPQGQSSSTSGFHIDLPAGYSYTFYPFPALAGGWGDSPDITVINDTCPSSVHSNGGSCNVDFNFTPTSLGPKQTQFTWVAHRCQVSYPFDCEDYAPWVFLWGDSIDEQPEKPCFVCGSLIKADSQSIIESVPIMGTEFSLVYSSEYSANYVSPYNTLGVKNGFNPNIWTVSAQHYYDDVTRMLWMGNGTKLRLKRTTDSGNLVVVNADADEVYVFTSGGRHLQTKTILTGITKYTFNYNGNNRITSIVDRFGKTTTFTRNGNGHLTQIRAPFGQTTSVTRDANQQLLTVTNPASQTYTFTYKTGTSLLETFTKPGSQVSTFTYDSNGRLTKDLAHAGNFWDLSASSGTSGTQLTMTSKMGRVTTIDSAKVIGGDQTRTETYPDGTVKTYVEKHNGEVVESISGFTKTTYRTNDERFGKQYKRPSADRVTINGVHRDTTYGKSVSYSTTPTFWNFDSITQTATVGSSASTSVYTASTRTSVFTSAEGATRTTKLNSLEQPIEWKAGNDTAWTATYGTNGLMTEVKQGTHNIITVAYNTSGFVSSLTNVRSEQTQFAYNTAGQITQVTLPDSRVIGYSYDANGNITGITPPSTPQHAFVYNAAELLGTYEPPSIGMGVTKDTTYTYNNDNQLTQITRPDGQTVDFTYGTTTGNLVSISSGTNSFSYVYDSTTRLAEKITSPDGIYSKFTFYGRTRASDAQQRASDDYLYGKTTFGFDSLHRVSSRTIQGHGTSPTSVINYTYNGDEVPTAIGAMSLVYSYPSGRLSGTTVSNVTDSYTYNAYGELETYTATYTPTSTVLYTYTLTRDLGGRITQKSETIGGVTDVYEYGYDSAGRLTTVEKNNVLTDSFTYDNNSNRTGGMYNGNSFSATYDDQDRMETYDSRTYTYNRNGDLSEIQWNVSQQSDFVYDVMGSLKQVTLPNGTVLDYAVDGLNRRVLKKSNGTFQWRYIYEDQYRIAAELDSSNAYTKTYVYGTKVNVPDYMVVGTTPHRIITDHLGSPRLVVNADSGTASQRMDYTILGEVTTDTSPGFQPFGFAGGLYDSDTQLVRFGARDYDPRSGGRWTTKDPIRFDNDEVNLYGYAMLDPVNFSDPTGEFTPGQIIWGTRAASLMKAGHSFMECLKDQRRKRGGKLCGKDEAPADAAKDFAKCFAKSRVLGNDPGPPIVIEAGN